MGRLVLLLLLGLVEGSCAGLGTTSRLTSSEKMMWSTYALATPKGLGTCVVINARDPYPPHGVIPVLVTSAHVLAVAPHGPFYVVASIPMPGASPDTAILELKHPGTDLLYVQHPRQDIAAFALRIPPEMANLVHLPSFIDEKAVAQHGKEPHAGDEISILGYPRIFPGTTGGFGVLRDGKIASYSAGTPQDRERFLVNTNAYSGDSGGPVFTGGRRGKPRLVGIMTQRIGEKEGTVPLAVAVNASVVRETLQILAQREATLMQGTATHKLSPSSRPVPSVKLVGPPPAFLKTKRAAFPHVVE